MLLFTVGFERLFALIANSRRQTWNKTNATCAARIQLRYDHWHCKMDPRNFKKLVLGWMDFRLAFGSIDADFSKQNLVRKI